MSKAITMTRTERSGHAKGGQGRIEFALLFAIAYPFFLLAVIAAKFLPREARNATYSAIPFAFM